jgi:hypothetical protein
LNVKKKKKKGKKREKKSGGDGIRSWDVWIKIPSPYRLRYTIWLKLTDKKISLKQSSLQQYNLVQQGVVLFLDIINIRISTKP